MNTHRQRRVSVERHANRLARNSIRYAGTLKDTARALGKSVSTVGHYATDRPHPALVEAFTVLLTLPCGRAFAQAVQSAVELREVLLAETETLTTRGVYLLDAEADVNAAADRASMTGRDLTGALRKQAAISAELADYVDELDSRGVDLLEVYRMRGAA